MRHSNRDAALLLLQQSSLGVLSELGKDAVAALEMIIKSSSFNFISVRDMLPLMSDCQLDLLSDEVSL